MEIKITIYDKLKTVEKQVRGLISKFEDFKELSK